MENGEKPCRNDQIGPLPAVRLPLYSFALRDVVNPLIKTVHDNTFAAIFTIGMKGLN